MAQATITPAKPPESKPARWQAPDINDMLQEMERFWERAWPGFSMRPQRRSGTDGTAWIPRIDVFKQNGNLVVKAELPGIKKDDINVAIEEGSLVIRGERREESEVKETDYYRMERSIGTFFRRLPLGFDPDPAQVKAQYNDGVLEIEIPKPPAPASESRKIDIA